MYLSPVHKKQIKKEIESFDNEVIEKNFVMPDEQINSESVARVKMHRNEMLIDAIAKALVAGIEFRNSMDKKEEEIPKHDVLCAGFPCQAFSLAGARKGFEDDYKGLCRGTLFLDVARICEKHKPKVIFCENVPIISSAS